MFDPLTAVAISSGIVGFIVGLLPGFMVGAAYVRRHKRASGVAASDSETP